MASAFAQAVAEDATPVWDDSEKEVSALAYWATQESGLRLHVRGDGGRSRGLLQQAAPIGDADALTQARGWLRLLHAGAVSCPASPAAPLSGGCIQARKLADRRVKKAERLLEDFHALASMGD